MNKRHNILFVDDDALILKGLRRSIEEYIDYWDADFAMSGKDAIAKLADTHFDAVVTDMSMPVMDGLHLLEEVSTSFPEVLRFILSGNTSDIHAVRSTKFVHQLFPKPCEVDILFQGVENACRLKDALSDKNLIRAITSIKTLPSKPALYDKLLTELQNVEPSIKVISDTISKDTAMTARVLQLVNSAFFGLADKVSNPQRAVSILGINTTKALVLGSHAFSEYEDLRNNPFSLNNLWKHSMLVSSVARKIAQDLNLSQVEQEDSQVAGILHDIGILLELKIPGFFRRLRLQNGKRYVKAENEVIGTSHAEMGAYLLGIWGLPMQIVDVVMYHHSPARLLTSQANVLTSLHIANGLVNLCTAEEKTGYEDYLDLEYLSKLIDIKKLDEWVEYIKDITSNDKEGIQNE